MYIAANDAGSLVFINVVIADRNIRVNSNVYGVMLSGQV